MEFLKLQAILRSYCTLVAMKHELKACSIHVPEDNYVDYHVEGYSSPYCRMTKIIKYKACKTKSSLILSALITLMNT